MIAGPNRHIQSETLRELLDDQLPHEQAEQIESHLDECDVCRNTLAQIAGPPQWWDETVGVLSQSTHAHLQAQTAVGSGQHQRVSRKLSLDASLEWIQPLFDESPDSDLGRIDQYPIQSVIGQGGMGVVLRGNDPELNRPVAIKILAPHLAGAGAARARFMREAQAAAAIVHPSIVPIYSIATAARLPYIVMPCISGGNLQERIDRQGPLELAEVLRIGLQIAEGLQAAHQQGVIHRDIKPANILIEEGNGRVLISDFGLARALDDATLTMSGMIAGTPSYMSPEQARGEAIDERTDLFSLGSLLYALAIGRPPFRAEAPLAVLRKICESRPRPIQQINERMPAWLDEIVGQLMVVDPARRLGSAGEAAAL
ncbi:MAG: protein kinase, partial [Pirellulales bacterium]|nr:protein kinase [Pirellulales bacterium]